MQEPIRYSFAASDPEPIVLYTGFTESVLFTDELELTFVNPALTFYSGWPTASQAAKDEDMLVVMEVWASDGRVLFAWPEGSIRGPHLRKFAESRRQAIIQETGRDVEPLPDLLVFG